MSNKGHFYKVKQAMKVKSGRTGFVIHGFLFSGGDWKKGVIFGVLRTRRTFEIMLDLFKELVKMHIPDGFLDTKTWASAYAVTGVSLAYSVKKVKQTLNDRLVPKMGVMAAFIFAAQMVNFPVFVIPGVSGHLLGAALAAITLGPWAATLIMSTVVTIQCFFFQDGGVTALGANILLMGVVAPWVAYLLYKVIAGKSTGKSRLTVAYFVSAWTSTFLASIVCTVLLAASGLVQFKVGLPAMAGLHALIGVGEGTITALVLSYLSQVDREYVSQTESA